MLRSSLQTFFDFLWQSFVIVLFVGWYLKGHNCKTCNYQYLKSETQYCSHSFLPQKANLSIPFFEAVYNRDTFIEALITDLKDEKSN